MVSDKTTKFIIKYARLFETASIIYSMIGIINTVLEIRILYFQNTGIVGWHRDYHNLMIGFFFTMFLMGYIAKTGFAVIRKTSNINRIENTNS